MKQYIHDWNRTLRKTAACFSGRRGNAVLVSLIVMASALTISLGLTSIVAGEIRNAGLTPPSERAYYKAESHIEQALWNRKQDPGFNAKDVPALTDRLTAANRANYVCDALLAEGCFAKDPKSHPSVLKDFVATTSSFTEDKKTIKQDDAVQLDVQSSSTGADNGSITIPKVENAGSNPGFRGIEVTVAAYDKVGGNPLSAASPVFIHKHLIKPGDPAYTFKTNDPIFGINALGESSPLLRTSQYRLRLRALGGDGIVHKPEARQGASDAPLLPLLASDFTVKAAAEDGRATRGVQVVTPVREDAAPIFDFVLFSDQDLEKQDPKNKKPIGATDRSVKAEVKELLPSGDCNDPGAPSLPGRGVPVKLTDAEGTELQTVSTDEAGQSGFVSLRTGDRYQLSINRSDEVEPCPPQVQDVPAGVGGPDSPQTYVFKYKSRTAKLFKYWSSAIGDHFYTINALDLSPLIPGWKQYQPNDAFYRSYTYQYEGCVGRVYTHQAAGTVPLSRYYAGQYPLPPPPPNRNPLWWITDHVYVAIANAPARISVYNKENIPEGYMFPASATQPPKTTALHQYLNGTVADHFYLSGNVRNHQVDILLGLSGWVYEGNAGWLLKDPDCTG